MTRRRPRRSVVVVLEADEFERLDAAARAEERDPFQQARFLILRGLPGSAPVSDADAGSDDLEPASVA